MTRKNRRLIFIGIDSMILDLVEEFVKKGLMPYTSKLISEGVYGYALPSMPTYTPTNWATIGCGCDPAIHRVFEWVFDSKSRKAESIWEVAAKHGRKVVLIRFPSSYPLNMNNVVVIGDGAPHDAVGVLEESKLYTSRRIYRYSGGLHGTFESVTVKWASSGIPRPPGIDNVCPDLEVLKSEIVIEPKGFEPVELYLLLYSSNCRSYDTLAIYLDKGFSKNISTLRKGMWSDFIEIYFRKRNGEVLKGVFRFKLLNSDPGDFQLYRSQIHTVKDFINPAYLEDEIINNVGYYIDNPSRLCLAHKCFETYFDELNYHLDWIYRASVYLKRKISWDMLFVQVHAIDYVQHELWHCIDPVAHGYREDSSCREVVEKTYSVIDSFIGGMLRLADEDTLIVVVSDHGHIARVRIVFLVDYLVDKGYIILNNDGSINVGKSIVREIKMDGLVLNTVWRYSDGIISKRSDYENIVNNLVDDLLSLKDGEKHVFYMVIPGWEADILGYREIDLDVLYAPKPGYTVVRDLSKKYHGRKEEYIGLPDPEYGIWGGASSTHEGLPTARLSIGTNKAIFIIKGPGVRKGLKVEYDVWLKDITPTICALLDLPIPRQVTGRIIYEVIDGNIYVNIV